jgi:Flp pilus assembly protein CpaB
MSRRVRFLVALIALAIALGGGYYAWRFYDSQVTTAEVVTLTMPVAPYTLITEEMLEVRQVPRGVMAEPIYHKSSEVAGKISAMPLVPGQLIYQHQIVPPSQFRYTDAPALEIMSFPVDPERAVGGQLRIGHKINVYRVRELKMAGMGLPAEGPWSSGPRTEGEAIPVLAVKGAEAEVLAEAVPVVDLRSGRGEPSADYYQQGIPGQEEENVRRQPLQVVTVAVPSDIAKKIIELAVEERGNYALWVSLAPLQEKAEEVASGQ